jgi:tetratricopeptide (TPR) repeat protein
LEINPTAHDTYVNRGAVYSDDKQYDLALADYKKALEFYTKDAKVYNNLGIIYKKKRLFDLALAEYNRALELEPDFSDGYNNRGAVYKELGKNDLALADFEKTLVLDPKNELARQRKFYMLAILNGQISQPQSYDNLDRP